MRIERFSRHVDLWEVSGDKSDCKFTRQNIFQSGQNSVSRILQYTEKSIDKNATSITL